MAVTLDICKYYQCTRKAHAEIPNVVVHKAAVSCLSNGLYFCQTTELGPACLPAALPEVPPSGHTMPHACTWNRHVLIVLPDSGSCTSMHRCHAQPATLCADVQTSQDRQHLNQQTAAICMNEAAGYHERIGAPIGG